LVWAILFNASIGKSIANTFFMKYRYWYWLYFYKVLLTTLDFNGYFGFAPCCPVSRHDQPRDAKCSGFQDVVKMTIIILLLTIVIILQHLVNWDYKSLWISSTVVAHFMTLCLNNKNYWTLQQVIKSIIYYLLWKSYTRYKYDI